LIHQRLLTPSCGGLAPELPLTFDRLYAFDLCVDVNRPGVDPSLDEAQASQDRNISCTSCGSAKELHAFWDGLLGPTDAPPEDAIDAAANLRTVEAGSRDEKDWIQESFEIAKRSVYAPPIRGGDGPYKLTNAYQKRALRIAKQRVSLSGSRIAAVLNDALK
jgi:hypothetical protein